MITVLDTQAPKWMPGSYRGVFEALQLERFIFQFPKSARQSMRKHKPILVSEHAEKYRVLTESDIKGPWRNFITPYLVDIMDVGLSPTVQTVILCKCVQSGGSEAAHNFVGFTVDRKPAPVLYVYPNRDVGRKQLKKRILTMFKGSPRLRRYLTGAVNDETNMEIRLKNTTVSIAWAHSPASLASDPMCYVIFDETDKYPPTASKTEADPISLGEARTTTYQRRRKSVIWKLSTPSTKKGPIYVALTCEAQVIFDYYAKCPFCGQHQKMIFERIKWKGGGDADPETVESDFLAWYKCEFCQGKWDDDARDRAVRGGEWRSRGQHPLTVKKYVETFGPKKVGFHLPAWISPFVSLSRSAAAFLRGQKNREKLKDFKNNFAAEPWEEYEIIATPREDEILRCVCKLPPQTVPENAVALTCGIDVQKIGFWYVVRAWAKDWTSWNIDHGHLGNWGDLEDLLYRQSYPVDGQEYKMRIWRAGIDTGGGKYSDVSSTEETYLWLQDQQMFSDECRIWGIKGASKPLPQRIKMGSVLTKTPSGKALKTGMRLIIVDPNRGKDMFHNRMEKARNDVPGGAFLHNMTSLEYAKQIATEQKQSDEKGYESWVKVRSGDNHYIDCEYYAGLLADWQWPGRGVNLLDGPVNIVHAKATGKKKKTTENPFTGGQSLFGG